jgi:hypothetical protein
MATDTTDAVPIIKGHEIRRERLRAWVHASIDAMSDEERLEFWDTIKFVGVALVAAADAQKDGGRDAG